VDAYRSLHPREAGHTFLSHDPHVRLDYVFLPLAFATRLSACDVFRHPAAAAASDHLPVLAELDVG
jgi:endonuclease/exonuclease/phosphatase family metal-dependent hydrolase